MAVITNLATYTPPSGGSGDGGTFFLPELFLKSGDKAFVRFLSATDGSDNRFGISQVHRMVGKGKNDKNFFYTKYCTMQDISQCALCDRVEDDSTVSKATTQFAVWVLVEQIWHTLQNPRGHEEHQELYTKSKTPDGRIVFVEKVNKIKLFKRGVGKGGYLLNFFNQFRTRYGGLDTRLYEISRSGTGKMDTSYFIMTADDVQAPLTDEQRALADTLPSIELVLMDRVKFDRETETFEVLPEHTNGPEDTVSDDEVVEAAVPTTVGTTTTAVVENTPVATSTATPEVETPLSRLTNMFAQSQSSVDSAVTEVD